jgi:hypothetical protein
MATPSSYAAVKSNLDAIFADPSAALDIPAIEKLKLEITENTSPSLATAILTQISQLLPILQDDPTPLTNLGIRATAFLKFSDLQAVDPPVNILVGIRAPSPPINLLALSLLSKANRAPSDAAIIAGDPDLVATLVELWLATPTTEVAQAALDVLWSLLEVDHVDNETFVGSHQNTAVGQGLLWRRVFTDKNVYGLMFSICSLADTNTTPQLSKREKTVAQGRLLDFIVKAGTLRWDYISASQIPEVESKYRSSSLLDFAACQMIDTSDVLMHMTLLNFYRELIQVYAPGLDTASATLQASAFSSRSLDFLVDRSLHQRVLGFYLDFSQLDAVDVAFLASPIMAYVARYAQLYPNHLLKSPRDLLDKILSRINESLDIPSAQWAHGQIPLGDLTVLGSLPRVLLVEASRRSLNPLQAVPSNPPNKDCYNTLARIFHGSASPSDTPVTVSNAPTDAHKESVAARILYFTYLNTHASLWQNVATAADIVAMKDVALAAIALIGAVVTANWKMLSAEDAQKVSATEAFMLPSEDELNRQASAGPGMLPTSGAWAVLTPPALTTVLPYLFKPPLSYSNFVAGGAGDPESVIWKLATAKYDVLVDLHRILKLSSTQVEGFEDIVKTLEQRIRDGPQGPATQVGSRVEALEM